MAISPTALYSAIADDFEEAGLTDESHLARCFAGLVNSSGFPASDGARAFIERECTLDSSDVTVTSAACRLLLKGMYWKYLSTSETDPRLDSVALDKFQTVNRQMQLWQYSPNTSGDEELMGSFKDILWRFWNPQGFPLVTGLHSLLDRGRTGPGVSVGSRGEDFYTKMFSSPITYTSEALLQTYLDWCEEEPTWLAAESTRCSTFGDPFPIQGSSLRFVPKDVRASRSIAVEPSLNMYFQLGLGDILQERIKTFFGLDLRYQQFWNRAAARVGSADVLGRKPDVTPTSEIPSLRASDHRGGKPWSYWAPGFATIDLSSASDSIGMNMLKWSLPSDFYRLLKTLRSPSAELRDGSRIELNMVSTMGNGFTFPLETLIFSCVVVAAIESYGLTPILPVDRNGNLLNPSGKPGEWGVFGDDIICHPEVAGRVLRLLSLLGFSTNSDKTFVVGPFRESCGCDCFRGHDIRAFYVKESLASRTSLYKAFNGFLEWSYRIGIDLPNTGRLLLTSLMEMDGGRIPLFVPVGEGRDAGARLPWSTLLDLFEKNEFLGIRRSVLTQSIIYDRLVPHSKQLRIADAYVSVPRRTRARIYNPSGLLIAFLRGDVRDGRISVRQSETRYRKRGCVTPYWDYIPPVHDWVRLVGDRVDMRRLETASRAMVSFLS